MTVQMTTIRLVTLGLAALVLAACGTAPERQVGRVATSQYKGWTIAVTPSSTSSDVWRARVRVWPKDVDPQRHGGIMLRFTGAARTESAVVASGMAFARAYVDDSTFDSAADPRRAPEPEARRTVTAEHSGWMVQITPSAPAADAQEWRAGVTVWPPGRSPERHGGIRLQFTEVAADQAGIVEAAMSAARRYIDASRTQHQ